MSKTTKSTKPETFVPFTNTDGHVAFEHFLPLAEARMAAEDASGELPRAARDVPIVRSNVERGLAAALTKRETIVAKQPGIDFDRFLELPSLVAAMDYAAGRVPVEMSTGEIAAMLAEVRPQRAITLLQLEILAEVGLVPAERVAAIRRGHGHLDTARDAVAISGLFAEYATALTNNHPFSAEQLATLGRLGNILVRALTPAAAKEAKSGPGIEARLRDALYTEVLARYEELREAAVGGFGLRDLDANVPPAHARVGKKKSPATVA